MIGEMTRRVTERTNHHGGTAIRTVLTPLITDEANGAKTDKSPDDDDAANH